MFTQTDQHTFPSPYGVSFILILTFNISLTEKYIISFRLLTEYHSFLFVNNLDIKIDYDISFRLLTEYHSFLLNFIGGCKDVKY